MQECPTSCTLPACFCRSPNLLSLVGKMFVLSARVVNTLDYGGIFQKPFSNAEVPLSTDRVSKTSENFGVHYQGLASDEVVPATACTAGGAASATLSMHSVWPNSKIRSALPDAARSPRVTKPDSDYFYRDLCNRCRTFCWLPRRLPVLHECAFGHTTMLSEPATLYGF